MRPYVRVAVHLERVLLLLPERVDLGLGLDLRLLQALAALYQSQIASMHKHIYAYTRSSCQ